MAEKRSVVKDILSIYVPAFFIMTGLSVITPVLSIYARSFGVPYTLATLAVSMYAVGRLFADLPSGMIGDRIGRRPLLLIGALIVGVSAFLCANAGSFWELVLYRLIGGVGSSMWQTMRITMLQDILKPEERGRILGYFQAFQLIGTSAGPTIGGVTAEYWGIRAPFLIYGVGSIICLVLSFILVPETHNASSRKESHSKEAEFSWAIMKRLLAKNLTFFTACIATFTTFLERQGLRSTLIPLYADVVLKLGTADIGYAISFATFTNLIVTIPFGHAMDRFGRKIVLVPSLALLGITSLVFPYAGSFLQLALACIVLGVGEGGTAQAPLTLASDATMNEPHGVSMAVYRVFGDLGYIVGPIMVGVLSDLFGLSFPFYAVSAIIVVSTVLVQVFAKEIYKRKN